MDHSYYKDKISAFSDGALEAQERELIKRHLEECAECRMILEQLNNFNRTIEEKSKLAGDEYFEKLAQKIEHRIAAPKEKAVDIREVRWKSFWWKVSAAAASILLVAVVVNYQLKEDSGRPSRMLQDMDRNEAPAAVSVDSTVVSENFENGRIDQTNEVVGNEIAGQTVDTEEATKKKVSAGKPDGQEKDERHMAASKELEGALKLNAPAVPAEDSKAESERPGVGLVEKTQVGERVSDDAVIIDKFETSLQSIVAQQNTLAGWRIQRDSIQTVLGFEQDTLLDDAKNQLKRLAEPRVGGYMQITDSGKIYQQLANSWYQIGAQTQDTTERNRAIQFLNWYKIRFPTDSPMVNQQLQQLPK